MYLQKGPRVRIIHRIEQLMVVRIMKERSQCGDSDIAIRLVFRDPQCIPVDAHSVIGVVPARICAKELLNICGSIFDQ